MAATNLPPALDTFIGRYTERAAALAALASSRMVTLTGPGGVGKTRLAIEVGRNALSDFPRGVWLIDLSAIDEKAVSPHVVANALDLRGVPFQRQTDQVVSFLLGGRVLLIFDNCEHVLDTVTRLIEELLNAADSLTVMATSREPLRATGERILRIRPLSLPSHDIASSDSDAGEAVELFLERVRAGGVQLDPEAAGPAIVAICRKLDGIPLAIELAAARVPSLPLEQLAASLDDRFSLLTAGPRTAPSRQQTLLASLEWSYDLLPVDARTVFRRLAVFSGHFSISAAQAVADAGDVGNVRDLFLELVVRSLVQMEQERSHAPYRLLETVREFALLRLEEADEVDAALDRHLDHYVRLATSMEASLNGPDAAETVGQLAAEHENLRAALDRAQERRFPDALRMTAALATYWFFRGHWDEARQRAATALDATDAPPNLRGRALAEVARIAATAVDAPTAISFGETALALGRRAEEPKVMAPALWALATIYAFLDPARARPFVAEAVDVARAGGMEHLYLRGLTTRAIVEAQSGEFQLARSGFIEAADRAKEAGMELALAPNRLWLAWTCFAQGDFEIGREVADDGIAICRKLGNPQFEAYLTTVLATAAAYQGKHELAKELSTQSREMAERLTDPAGLVGALTAEAVVRYWFEDSPSAMSTLDEVIPLAQTIGPTWLHAFGLTILSDLQRAAANMDDAMASARKAGEIGRRIANRWIDARARLAEARVFVSSGDPAAGARLIHEAMPTFVDLGARPELALGLETAAWIQSELAEHDEAARTVEALSLLLAEMGYVLPLALQREVDEVVARLENAIEPSELDRLRTGARESGIQGVVEYLSRGWGPRHRPRAGWESLTPTELKVATLVGEGLNNPQIGERMFISRRTVQTHLTHVFAKLGISSRSELASEVARRASST